MTVLLLWLAFVGLGIWVHAVRRELWGLVVVMSLIVAWALERLS